MTMDINDSRFQGSFLTTFGLHAKKNGLDKTIKDALKVKGNINIKSIITGLAFGGYFTDVTEVLREQNFNLSSLNAACLGYACGNHINQVNNLLCRHANPNAAIRGFGISNKVTEINRLLAMGAGIEHAVFGLAAGGHIQEVEDQLKKHQLIIATAKSAGVGIQEINNQLNKYNLIINMAVSGAVLCGYIEFAKQLIEKGASINSAIYSAANGKYDNFVIELIDNGANIDLAIEGAAHGGHFTFVNTLISKQEESNVNNAIVGAIKAGYEQYSNSLIQENFCNIDDAIKTACKSQNLSYASQLVTNNQQKTIFLNGVKEILQNCDTSLTLRFLSSIKYETLCNITDEIHKKYPYLLSKDIVEKSKNISLLISNGNINYEQAEFLSNPMNVGMLWIYVTLTNKGSTFKEKYNKQKLLSLLPVELWSMICSYVIYGFCSLSQNDLLDKYFLNAMAILLEKWEMTNELFTSTNKTLFFNIGGKIPESIFNSPQPKKVPKHIALSMNKELDLAYLNTKVSPEEFSLNIETSIKDKSQLRKINLGRDSRLELFYRNLNVDKNNINLSNRLKEVGLM